MFSISSFLIGIKIIVFPLDVSSLDITSLLKLYVNNIIYIINSSANVCQQHPEGLVEEDGRNDQKVFCDACSYRIIAKTSVIKRHKTSLARLINIVPTRAFRPSPRSTISRLRPTRHLSHDRNWFGGKHLSSCLMHSLYFGYCHAYGTYSGFL